MSLSLAAGLADGVITPTEKLDGTNVRLTTRVVFHHPDGRRAKIKRKDFPKVAA